MFIEKYNLEWPAKHNYTIKIKKEKIEIVEKI
jgi:hypothetical protein